MHLLDVDVLIETKRRGSTNELQNKMHIRNCLKKQEVNLNDGVSWNEYKRARNQTNNAIKRAKQQYFSTNLEHDKNNPRQTARAASPSTYFPHV